MEKFFSREINQKFIEKKMSRLLKKYISGKYINEKGLEIKKF